MNFKREYEGVFTPEEIERLEVRYEMIRTMSDEELYENLKHLGFGFEDMKKLKEIELINRMENE